MQVKFSRFDPMLVMLLGGNAPERTLFALSQALKDRIAGLEGVLEVCLLYTSDAADEVSPV